MAVAEDRLEGLKAKLRRFDTVYQWGSFAHCWAVCGRKEAVRRYQEHQEEKRIRAELARQGALSPEERARQEAEVFPDGLLVSGLVPLYNTPVRYLRAMLDSVAAQTYSRWELCLADGSDAAHPEVEKECRARAAQDGRIRYQRLEKNLGISGNTNACIDMAGGAYLALFDHDDLLHPSALYEVMKAVRDRSADFIYTDETTFHEKPEDAFLPHFKPDYAPDTLRSNNYICHFTVFSRALLERVGGFRSEFDGSQDYDLVLRLTEQARNIVHLPRILYYWRAHSASVAQSIGAKPYVTEAAKRALGEHLSRVGLKGEVVDSAVPSIYRIRYAIEGEPLISVLIPNRDHAEDLERCVSSIRRRSTWQRYELLIIDHGSVEQATFDLYSRLEAEDGRVRVLRFTQPFNYSAINNFGAGVAKGDYLLLLNNDTEILSPDWMQEMLMFAQRPDVGAVGAKLLYPDGTVQHGGIGVGIMHLAGHLHRGFPGDAPGYMGRLCYAQNLSAVTAACMLVPRLAWEAAGGMDESYPVVFNDVDFCLRLRKAGLLIVWTPFAELIHYESKTRGSDEDTPEKLAFFKGETRRFQTKWNGVLTLGDPYYNPNLTRKKEDFSPRV